MLGEVIHLIFHSGVSINSTKTVKLRSKIVLKHKYPDSQIKKMKVRRPGRWAGGCFSNTNIT
jgi:hypothetical protein